MSTEAHKFQVGVFVIVTSLLGVGLLIWLGASRFFEKTQPFVSYFSESVQGLDTGSPVKYRGVPGGRVQAIRIAPDGELIEVTMDIDVASATALKKDPSLRATLELSGITGLRYVEIDRHAGERLNQSPTLTFKPPYEVIPSARSSFKAVQAAVADVYERFMQLDIGGISNDTRATLQAANQLLRDERFDAVLNNLKAVTQSTDQLVKNLDAMTTGVQLAPAVAGATRVTDEAHALISDLRTGQTGTQLREALEQITRLALSAQEVVVSLQSTADRLNRGVGSLQSLTEQVREQPSLLLFSQPPPQRVEDGTQ